MKQAVLNEIQYDIEMWLRWVERCWRICFRTPYHDIAREVACHIEGVENYQGGGFLCWVDSEKEGPDDTPAS